GVIAWYAAFSGFIRGPATSRYRSKIHHRGTETTEQTKTQRSQRSTILCSLGSGLLCGLCASVVNPSSQLRIPDRARVPVEHRQHDAEPVVDLSQRPDRADLEVQHRL